MLAECCLQNDVPYDCLGLCHPLKPDAEDAATILEDLGACESHKENIYTCNSIHKYGNT